MEEQYLPFEAFAYERCFEAQLPDCEEDMV